MKMVQGGEGDLPAKPTAARRPAKCRK